MTTNVLAKLGILLLLYERAAALIVPEEVPTILSLIYSNIPPIKKGTDSRIGVGFRLGEHADFQVLLELGPQTETDPIGNADTKRRRDAMLGAAMRGELGPLAQAVAKYQIERKLQRELDRSKKVDETANSTATPENDKEETAASEWLTKWSKHMAEDRSPLEDVSREKSQSEKRIEQKIGIRPAESTRGKGSVSDLKNLYKQRDEQKTDRLDAGMLIARRTRVSSVM